MVSSKLQQRLAEYQKSLEKKEVNPTSSIPLQHGRRKSFGGASSTRNERRSSLASVYELQKSTDAENTSGDNSLCYMSPSSRAPVRTNSAENGSVGTAATEEITSSHDSFTSESDYHNIFSFSSSMTGKKYSSRFRENQMKALLERDNVFGDDESTVDAQVKSNVVAPRPEPVPVASLSPSSWIGCNSTFVKKKSSTSALETKPIKDGSNNGQSYTLEVPTQTVEPLSIQKPTPPQIQVDGNVSVAERMNKIMGQRSSLSSVNNKPFIGGFANDSSNCSQPPSLPRTVSVCKDSNERSLSKVDNICSVSPIKQQKPLLEEELQNSMSLIPCNTNITKLSNEGAREEISQESPLKNPEKWFPGQLSLAERKTSLFRNLPVSPVKTSHHQSTNTLSNACKPRLWDKETKEASQDSSMLSTFTESIPPKTLRSDTEGLLVAKSPASNFPKLNATQRNWNSASSNKTCTTQNQTLKTNPDQGNSPSTKQLKTLFGEGQQSSLSSASSKPTLDEKEGKLENLYSPNGLKKPVTSRYLPLERNSRLAPSSPSILKHGDHQGDSASDLLMQSKRNSFTSHNEVVGLNVDEEIDLQEIKANNEVEGVDAASQFELNQNLSCASLYTGDYGLTSFDEQMRLARERARKAEIKNKSIVGFSKQERKPFPSESTFADRKHDSFGRHSVNNTASYSQESTKVTDNCDNEDVEPKFHASDSKKDDNNNISTTRASKDIKQVVEDSSVGDNHGFADVDNKGCKSGTLNNDEDGPKRSSSGFVNQDATCGSACYTGDFGLTSFDEQVKIAKQRELERRNKWPALNVGGKSIKDRMKSFK